MKRKIISLLLCFVMALSLIPTVASGVDEGPSDPLTTNGAYSDNGWSAGGTGTITTTDGLTLSKTATYLSENTYRIDLKVITKQTTTTVTTSSDAATVLVIDCSGSMAWCSNNHRHTDNCYSTEECTPESNPSHWVDALGRQWHAWDTSCRYDLNSGKYYKVSNTCGQTQHTHDNATGGKWCGGSGDPRIKSAKDAAMTFIDNYKDSSAERWVAVVSFANSAASSNWFNVSTSEGYTGAETFINNLDASGATNLDAGLSAASNLMSQNTVSAVVKDNKNVIALTDGAPTKSASHGNGQYGSSQINDQTKNTATTLKGNVNALYTICFGASGETCYQGGPTVDAFLKNSIASSGNAYTADTASDLDLAFGKITDTITSGLDGKGWTVTDPMADNITVTGTLPENFTLTDDTSKTYTWTLNNPTVEENGSEKVYIYATSYNVTIDPNGAGLNEKDFYPANKVTTLNYSDADGTSKTATFPVPGVKVKLPAPTTGSLIITKAFIGLPDGTTPDSVSFTVTGINYSETVTLSANDQWSKKIDNLTPGTYTVTETSATVPGYTYTTTGTGNATVEAGKDTPVTVTNTYVPATISVTVTKEWNHNGVPADMQPKSVEVNLMNGDTVAATEKLNAGNSWTHTFENLPVKDADGNDITYTVQEKDVPDGYTAAVTGSAANGFTITNTAAWADNDQVNPVSLTITKVDGEDDTKLSGAVFTLTKQDASTAVTPLTATTGEDGTCTFTGLTEGYYELKETKAPDGYKQTNQTWTIVVVKDEEPSDIVLNEETNKFQKVYDCTVYKLIDNELSELTNGLPVTNEKAPDGYTVTLPIQKIVEKKAGSKNPGKTTFAFAATMYDGQTETTTKYGTAAIETNGVGTYDGTLKIEVPANLFTDGNGEIMLQLSEVKGTNSKWSYDDTVYIVLIKVEDYKVTFGDVIPDIALLATDDEEQEPTVATFTNTYSYKYTPTPKPTTVTSVKTGDMGVALYAVTSLLSLSGAAVIIKKRKDEE